MTTIKQIKSLKCFLPRHKISLLYAITQQTASELICTRANAKLPNMGLTSWKGAVVRKGDIIVAKNYLTHDELDSLNRLVMIF